MPPSVLIHCKGLQSEEPFHNTVILNPSLLQPDFQSKQSDPAEHVNSNETNPELSSYLNLHDQVEKKQSTLHDF